MKADIPQLRDGAVSVPATGDEPISIWAKPITLTNWYTQVEWFNLMFSLGLPLYAFIQAYTIPLQWQTLSLAVFYYCCTGIAISAGMYKRTYHISLLVAIMVPLPSQK